jgi:V/A-type H+/Na+-transporting ATPase subunit D
MAKIKHTKNELKAQREALARYRRFLPMLQLKKQQLQMEILGIDAALAAKRDQAAEIRASMDSWFRLFSEPVDLTGLASLEEAQIDEGNVAGVVIPVLRDVRIRRGEPDLFATPPWVDDAAEALARLIRLRVETETLQEQRRRIEAELRVTAQRVNLFEKVKIPECVENIRVVRIFLGDEQTAGVARGKIAKARAAA